MHSRLFILRTIIAGAFLIFPLTFGPSANAAAKASKTTATPVATTSGNTIAAGASEDSLKSCLSRIPKDATVGQRMIAEQSCQRDEGERKPFQATGSY
jgi:hypothetical protein